VHLYLCTPVSNHTDILKKITIDPAKLKEVADQKEAPPWKRYLCCRWTEVRDL
jgi:hypothetical protein